MCSGWGADVKLGLGKEHGICYNVSCGMCAALILYWLWLDKKCVAGLLVYVCQVSQEASSVLGQYMCCRMDRVCCSCCRPATAGW